MPARIAAIAADPRARRAAFVVAALLFTITVAGWIMAVVVAPSGSSIPSRSTSGSTWTRSIGSPSATRGTRIASCTARTKIALGDVLYPPILLYLLAPFRLLGPWPWWVIPAAAIAWVVWRHRPGPWALVAIAVCLLWPVTPAKFVFGNPVIWAAAAVALGTFYRWPAAFALVKPTVAVFAIIGIRDRRWWFAVAAMAVASLPFLADTLLYPQVLLDAQTNPVDGRGGPSYSLQEFPLMAIPVIAWLGRRRAADAPTA